MTQMGCRVTDDDDDDDGDMASYRILELLKSETGGTQQQMENSVSKF